MEEIISWCNDNSGFINMIFSFSSLTISLVAIIISVRNSIKQKNIQLLDIRKSAFNEAMELLNEYDSCKWIIELLGGDKPYYKKKNHQDVIVTTFSIVFNNKYCNMLNKALEAGKEYERIDRDICTYLFLLERSQKFDVIQKIKNYEKSVLYPEYYCSKYDKNEFILYCKENEIFDSPCIDEYPEKMYNYQVLSEKSNKAYVVYDKLKKNLETSVQKYLRSI